MEQERSVWGRKMYGTSSCPNCGEEEQNGHCTECSYDDPSAYNDDSSRKFMKNRKKFLIVR